jgi:murein DD-endopeptidase MepM/ murein hydrolase activator NlpD
LKGCSAAGKTGRGDFTRFSSQGSGNKCRIPVMSISPLSSQTPVSTIRSTPTASPARAASGSEEFAQLLAWQMSQGSAILGASDTPANATDDIYSSLLPAGLGASSALGGLGQLEGMLTVRLLEVVERLLSNASATPAVQAPTGLPTTGPISQGYHTGHSAIDVAVPVGTPIHSTMPGKVAYAGWNTEGYGNLVIVENGAYRTYYAHLQSIPVTVGQTVAAGEVVGLSGNTGHSTGPHLHYEVRVDGRQVPPVAAA